MKRYPHPVVAREGWHYLAVMTGASALVTWAVGWAFAIPFWITTLFVLQFFRDPAREIPENPDAVLSPADGRIVAVEKVVDPYLDRESVKVSVFMNVFNVHSNRSPVDGEVKKIWYFPGKFVNADLDKASLENERNAVWIRTDEGIDVTSVQVAGLIARRILCYVKEGQKVSRGQRYGFIRFGSRVDVYLPPESRILVGIGDKVYATESILAELK